MRYGILILASMLLLSAGSTVAGEWKLDKNHSGVNFGVTHLIVDRVTGTFGDFDVALDASRDDFSDMSIQAVIRAASINTGNEKRDRHVRGDDFLSVDRFPEIRFNSTGVRKTGEGRYDVTGMLTIRDVTREVVLDTNLNGVMKDSKGGSRAGFEASVTINRFDYGVKWDAVTETGSFVAGKEIKITLLMSFVNRQES